MSKPVLVSKHVDLGREVWAKFDQEAEVYELFASSDCDDYIGYSVDTMSEARIAATDYFNDCMSF
mgnify:CR=1 FL=1